MLDKNIKSNDLAIEMLCTGRPWLTNANRARITVTKLQSQRTMSHDCTI